MDRVRSGGNFLARSKVGQLFFPECDFSFIQFILQQTDLLYSSRITTADENFLLLQSGTEYIEHHNDQYHELS